MTEHVEKILDGLVDDLATIEHERWAHWQRYLHEKCAKQPDGSLTIPANLVAQWERQIATPFSELSDEEKDSDREQVDKYLPLIKAALSR